MVGSLEDNWVTLTQTNGKLYKITAPVSHLLIVFIFVKVALRATPSRHQKLKTWPAPSRRALPSSGSCHGAPPPVVAPYLPPPELAGQQGMEQVQDSPEAPALQQCSPTVAVDCTSQHTLGKVSWSVDSFCCKRNTYIIEPHRLATMNKWYLEHGFKYNLLQMRW